MVPDGAPMFGPAEAAWFEVYGRDLVDDLWGPQRFSRRRIMAMLDGLPQRCALWRALAGTAAFDHDYVAHLLRQLLSSNETLRAQLYPSKARKKFKALEAAEPWTRPRHLEAVEDGDMFKAFTGIVAQVMR